MPNLSNVDLTSIKYIARVSFKFKTDKFKSFDDIDPKVLKWSSREVLELLTLGRIMPFDNSLDGEVFPELFTLQYRFPHGVSSEFRDMRQAGKLFRRDGEAILEEELVQPTKAMSTKAINQAKEELPTTEVPLYPYERHAGFYPHEVPGGVDGSVDDLLEEPEIPETQSGTAGDPFVEEVPLRITPPEYEG